MDRNPMQELRSRKRYFVNDNNEKNRWFWSVCLIELRKNTPNSITVLVNTVERYAASLNKDQIITAVNNILARAQSCIESDRGTFEYKLKSLNKRLNR